MSVPSKPDRSLLDRLNALKPSSISLAAPQQRQVTALGDAPSTDITPSALPSAAAPVTREDRLSARLKTLREARDGDADKGGDGHENEKDNGSEPEKPGASPSPEEPKGDEVATSKVKSPGADNGKADDVTDDPLFYVDDEAVNDLLLELAAEGLGEDEELLDGEDEADRLARGDGTGDDDGLIPLPSVPKRLGNESSDDEDNDADNSKMVEDLLKSLAGTTIKDDAAGNSKKDKPKDGHDSDDSDGDDMQREVRRVLEEAQDEVDLAKQRGEANDEDQDQDEDEDIITGPRRRSTGQDNEPIPPRDAPKKDDDDADNFLGLPAVPTRLVDPPPSPPSLPSVPSQKLPKRGDDDDISARLAALRGLQGKAAGLGQTDAFGLPSAPTFRPGEEEGGVLKRGHFGHGRNNYTDADQKAWCVVCLEDATVRCLGCADNNGGDEDDQNNAYCDRCWRDMHVGPAAGFDERGHKRVPLVR